MPGPITSLFDDLIKEIVETFYRFLVMTIGGLLIPFAKHTKRFWPGMLSLESRFSSLSFLLIWTFLSFSLILGNLAAIPNAIVEKKPNYSTLYILILSFSLVIFIEAIQRCCFFLIRNRIRRKLYPPIIRICIGIIAFGSFAIFTLEVSLGRNPAMDIIFGGIRWWSPASIQTLLLWNFPILFFGPLILFASSLAIITKKLLNPKRHILAIFLSLATILVIPSIILTVANQLFLKIRPIMSRLFPEPQTAITQVGTQCHIDGTNSVTVSSYLLLLNSPSIVASGDWFDVIALNHETGTFEHVGTGIPKEKIVLTNTSYVPFHFTLDRPISAPTSGTSGFECDLRLNISLRGEPLPIPGRGD